MERIAFPQLIAGTIALVSAGALGLAFIAQYGFDLWPCLLCYQQRTPYALTLGLGLLCLLPGVDTKMMRHAIMLCALLFAINTERAAYHAGVEYGWFEPPAFCGAAPRTFDIQDMTKALSQPLRGGCEEAAFRDPILKLSMAGWNVIVCGLMTAFLIWAARQKARWNGP